jgi:hypothetical protein
MRGSRAVINFAVFMILPTLSVTATASVPYPPSNVIKNIVWAPADTMTRKAAGGDNWPITWADDDAIYTTWGDGWGFKPKVSNKLSMGFARIVGEPGNFTGTNIRSPAEQLGGGRSGRKGWGIISVDGVLYLLMGHADRKGGQAQLAWSHDHARTWTFASWKFPQFGLMGFVNFGKDYMGARDNYIYSYSHDGPLADTPADHFILMRVPKNRITERRYWEFFERIDEAGHAVWTSDIERRGAVFFHSDCCLRSAMTYNAPLRRYLWWQQIPKAALPCTMHRNRGAPGQQPSTLNAGMLAPENTVTSRPSGLVRMDANFILCFPVTIALVSERQRSFLSERQRSFLRRRTNNIFLSIVLDGNVGDNIIWESQKLSTGFDTDLASLACYSLF